MPGLVARRQAAGRRIERQDGPSVGRGLRQGAPRPRDRQGKAQAHDIAVRQGRRRARARRGSGLLAGRRDRRRGRRRRDDPPVGQPNGQAQGDHQAGPQGRHQGAGVSARRQGPRFRRLRRADPPVGPARARGGSRPPAAAHQLDDLRPGRLPRRQGHRLVQPVREQAPRLEPGHRQGATGAAGTRTRGHARGLVWGQPVRRVDQPRHHGNPLGRCDAPAVIIDPAGLVSDRGLTGQPRSGGHARRRDDLVLPHAGPEEARHAGGFPMGEPGTGVLA